MSKFASGQTLIQAFEAWSPKSLAIGDDRNKIGLQLGTLNKPVKKVMVTLDVLENVVDEAIAQGVDLIIAHHPMMFHPVKRIDTDTARGRMIEKCLRQGIAVYAAHTNLDVAVGGVNDRLAEVLGVEDTEIFIPTQERKLVKFAVYVPESHAEAVRQALGDVGAGHIGRYSHCSFNSRGTGMFLPGEGTNPHIGTKGKWERVEEVKIETILPEELTNQAIAAMKRVHPYEEVAYDLYALQNEGDFAGVGRIGELSEPMPLHQFATHVKTRLQVRGVRFVGQADAIVKKVAVLGGDGNKFMSTAKRKGADVYVTGDVYFHTAHEAWMDGLNVVDPGHYAEKVMKEEVSRRLNAFVAAQGYDTEVFVSKTNTDPFHFV
ncbi:MAG TPA: Nif3-like dinuclear metal center hexameric protein [Bacillales bacterium]|nr:Nif3-like dinuclear metal center hexameric protein [Bacillales bacterium]